MIIRIVPVALFLLSALLAPWWVTVPYGIVVVAYARSPWAAILGGLIMDVTFGAPIASLGGFSYLYTALFAFLSLIAVLLRSRMIE